MDESGNRRPLKSRQTGWAHKITASLAGTGITPNQISIGSMVAALLAGAAFALSAGHIGWPRALLLLSAALFCQLRLLCNLFDGMAAVEAGKKTGDGAAWNEFPDRFADIFIFAGLGYAISQPSLGWAAACLSVLTAYVRELGASITQQHDFGGPMAKQHRMAAVTLAALVAAFLSVVAGESGNSAMPVFILLLCLWIVIAGALLTSLLRLMRMVKKLNQTGAV